MQRVLASLSWKAAAAVTFTALAFGTGAATSFNLIGDSHADEHRQDAEHRPATTTTTTTIATTAADDDKHKGDGVNTAGTNEHPDNFGAIVSADAQDGGVDGQEISEMAHERNEDRAAARDTAASAADAGADEADDHGHNAHADDHAHDDDHHGDDVDDD